MLNQIGSTPVLSLLATVVHSLHVIYIFLSSLLSFSLSLSLSLSLCLAHFFLLSKKFYTSHSTNPSFSTNSFSVVLILRLVLIPSPSYYWFLTHVRLWSMAEKTRKQAQKCWWSRPLTLLAPPRAFTHKAPIGIPISTLHYITSLFYVNTCFLFKCRRPN